MKFTIFFGRAVAIAALAAAMVSAPAKAQSNSESSVALPFDTVGYLDGAKYKIRVPANWNGKLLIYLQGTKTVPTPEPSLTPPVVSGSTTLLEPTLLSRGYALAASEFGTTDMQAKEAAQDTQALASYFKGRVGEPTRVLLWSTSNGALVSLKLLEDAPRSFAGGLATCAPTAGFARAMDRHLDFTVAYAAAFGWPEDKLGPINDLKPGLDFNTVVMPNIQMPKADGSNRGKWEFIRLVHKVSPESFWPTNPLFGYPGFVINLAMSIWGRSMNESYAAGPFVQNTDHEYSLTQEEVSYLAGLGVNATELLDKMNAMRTVSAAPVSRDYAERFGGLRGTLRRPALSIHNTQDNVAEAAQENSYRAQVEWWGKGDMLFQTYVKTPGHCVFSAEQILAALDALERWLDSGVKPADAAFPESLGFVPGYKPPAFPY